MTTHRSNLALVLSHDDADVELSARPSDRRAHERLTPADIAWLERARLKYGPAVSLIDLSSGGAQIEIASHRLHPGTNVVIELAGARELTVPSRVLRCQVSAIVPHTTYRGAIEFRRPIDLRGVGRRPMANANLKIVRRSDRSGWNRLVVRYNDGRMLKGYGRDFFPPNGCVHVWPAAGGAGDSRITVPLNQLKAVFYVHDLDGGTAIPDSLGTTAEPGRQIIVIFADGEVLTGTTLNYSGTAPGFFMWPTGEKSNNLRVFVVASALRQVQFP